MIGIQEIAAFSRDDRFKSRPSTITPSLLVGVGDFGEKTVRSAEALVQEIEPDWAGAMGICVLAAHGDQQLEDEPQASASGEDHQLEEEAVARVVREEVSNIERHNALYRKGYNVDTDVLACVVVSFDECVDSEQIPRLGALLRRIVPEVNLLVIASIAGEDLDLDYARLAIQLLDTGVPALDDAVPQDGLFDRVFVLDAWTRDSRLLRWPDDGVNASANLILAMLDTGLHVRPERRDWLVGKTGLDDHRLPTAGRTFISTFGIQQFRFHPAGYVDRFVRSTASAILGECVREHSREAEQLSRDFRVSRRCTADELPVRLFENANLERLTAGLRHEIAACKSSWQLHEFVHEVTEASLRQRLKSYCDSGQQTSVNLIAEDAAAVRDTVSDLVQNSATGLSNSRGFLETLLDDLRDLPRGEDEIVGSRAAEERTLDSVQTDLDDLSHEFDRCANERELYPLALPLTFCLLVVTVVVGIIVNSWSSELKPQAQWTTWAAGLVASATLLGGIALSSQAKVREFSNRLETCLGVKLADAAAIVRAERARRHVDKLREDCQQFLERIQLLESELDRIHQALAQPVESFAFKDGSLCHPIPAGRVLEERGERVVQRAAGNAERWMQEVDPFKNWQTLDLETLELQLFEFSRQLVVDYRDVHLESHLARNCPEDETRIAARTLLQGSVPFLQINQSIPDLQMHYEQWLLSAAPTQSVIGNQLDQLQASYTLIPSDDPYAISLLTLLCRLPLDALERLNKHGSAMTRWGEEKDAHCH